MDASRVEKYPYLFRMRKKSSTCGASCRGNQLFALIPIVSSPLRQYTSMRQVEDTRDGKSN